MNLPKTYEPKQYESDIYKLWEVSGAFKPTGEGEPYTIVMPPPNANGNLHIGHALITYLQDILTRYNRAQGKRALWIPGADHAGFETWVVYERQLEKEGKSRFDFSREELYRQTWDFVAQNRGSMESQVRSLGASCDWSKQTFTLDPNVVAATYRTFEKMWNEGLIYRGERIVNYCTKHDTSFADIEVAYKDETSYLWTIAYPLSDDSDFIEIATTRPETLLGDVAVAVNPQDEKLKRFIGKTLRLPLVDREIPVIADEMVDLEFGTGAVKITPAHDPNDFEVSERHPELERISVIGFDGRMTDNVPEKYLGLTSAEAREAVLEDLKALNLLTEAKEYTHSVGHCYKCDTVIQPLLKDQWFIAVQSLAERAIRVIEKGEITFTPENKGRVLVQYLKNLKDWNISRQIPWGIPIPAFQNIEDQNDWIFDVAVDQETIEKDGKTYKRDADTFDTWFSSGQWPFITTLFSADGGLEDHYPLSVMETGVDILYPWVSRMIMLGLYVTDQVPFKEVYLNGLVLDPQGQKMSKSKDNVVNPIEVVDAFGSDAVRMGLISARSAGQNQAFSKDKVIAGRNFCNKLWNVARYIENVLGDQLTEAGDPQPQSPVDHWIIKELVDAKRQTATLLEQYRFSEASEVVYHTIWDKVADWYIEASKSSYSAPTMLWVLEACLVLAHPFTPFVTETIWQTLDWHSEEEDLLITTQWQLSEEFDEAQAKQFEEIQKIVSETREILSIIGTRDIALTTTDSKIVLENADMLQNLTKVGYIRQVEEGSGLRLTATREHAWLSLGAEEIQTYKTTLEKKLVESQKSVDALEHRLANEKYIKSAPEQLVAESREALKLAHSKSEHLRHQLKHL
jgi:valyl-tRNA synthetase